MIGSLRCMVARVLVGLGLLLGAVLAPAVALAEDGIALSGKFSGADVKQSCGVWSAGTTHACSVEYTAPGGPWYIGCSGVLRDDCGEALSSALHHIVSGVRPAAAVRVADLVAVRPGGDERQISSDELWAVEEVCEPMIWAVSSDGDPILLE